MGQLSSWTGRQLQEVALAWLVLDLTGSPAALGLFTAFRNLPLLVLSLTAGVFIDRLPKRNVMMTVNLTGLEHSVALAALALGGVAEMWQVYVLGMLLGCIQLFDNTTRDAFVSQLVDRDRLHNAVSLNSTCTNLARIVGPAIGGVIIAAGGTGWCFLLNAVATGIAATTLALIRTSELQPEGPRSAGGVRSQLADGLRYVKGEPALHVPLVLQLFIGLFGYNFATYVPLLARFAFDAGPVGLGLLVTARGIGAIGAGFFVAGRAVLGSGALPRAAGLFGAVLAALALSPTLAVGLVCIGALGAAEVYYRSSIQTTMLLAAQEGYRGRVLSLSSMMTGGSSPFGATFTGTVADHWGIRTAVVFCGSFCMMGAFVGTLVARRGAPKGGS